MDLGVRGRCALVAGGSRGIGFAAARRLVDAGADVALVARNEAALADAAERLSPAGVRVEYVAADLSTAGGVERAFAESLEKLGRIDILINNGGGPKAGVFDQLGDGDWQAAFDLVVMNTVRMTRLALGEMRQRKWGRVVNVMSTSVRQPVENLMLSNSLRMSVVGMMKTLTLENAGLGITFNTVAPGFTRTERLASLARSTAASSGKTIDQVQEEWAADVPLRRLGDPEEIAAAIVFLASGPAAYINGVVLPVDGGRVRAS